MKKKEIIRFAATAAVTAAGALTGVAMMVLSGKKIEEKENGYQRSDPKQTQR